MTDEPIELDTRRGSVEQKSIEVRRRLIEVNSGQTAASRQLEELETLVAAEPSKTWPEVAAKAQYLLRAFAATAQGREPQCKKLIVNTLKDLSRMCNEAEGS